jgi:glycosyltransferase involved in cell wall biosynthesis
MGQNLGTRECGGLLTRWTVAQYFTVDGEKHDVVCGSIEERELPMKILFLTTEDYTFWLQVSPLAVAAKREGADVVVMTRSGEYCSRLEESGLRIVPWSISRPSLNPFRELYSFLQVLKVYRREKPDLVHHIALKPIIYGGIAARLCDAIPAVATVTGLGYVFTSRTPFMWLLRQLLSTVLQRVFKFPNSKVIVQNDDDRDLLVAQKIVSPKKTVVIAGFGVNPNDFVPLPEPSGVPVVMLPARMIWEKGVGEFVKAAQELKSRCVLVRMVLVGAPDPRNKGCISETQLKTWVNSGFVEWWGPRDDMPAVLNQSNVVCLPSYREGLPKVLMEAAACGRAIVTTRAPGCAHVVRNDENGLLVPIKDPRALATAIDHLLRNESVRKQMGTAGRLRVVREFSDEKVAYQTMKVYEALMNGKWHVSDRPHSEQEERVFVEV